jgi:outer membrane receptor protein involved in Fe transport
MTGAAPATSRIRRACLVGLWALLSASSLLAADETKRQYRLRAGDAAVALREFAAASGREILFAAEAVKGVRTAEVRGEFTAFDALTRLVAGTELYALQDERTGALAVRRRPVSRPPPPSPSPRSVESIRPTGPPETSMPSRPFLSLLASWFLAGGAVAATPTPAETAAAAADPVRLSPFEVKTDLDTGFAATSALTGGRLATDLRDTAAAYSIVTKDFITTLGITDIGEAAQWSVGNFPVLDTNVGLMQGNPVQYTTRGFNSFGGTNGGSKPQRNFFPNFSNSDSYNLERYEFGRGPNSVLFGNGTLGGIPSSTTIRAQTERPFQTVSIGFGSWSNQRATLDVNQPLNSRLAIRTALVWQDSEAWRYKDFDKRKGIFVTTTFKPFRHTEIRLEGEYNLTSRQAGLTNIVESFSGWDGVTTYNAAVPLPALGADANTRGVLRIGAPYYVYDPLGPANALINYESQPITRSGGSHPQTPIGGFLQGSLPPFGTANAPILHMGGIVPANRFSTALARSNFRMFGDEFTMSPDAPVLTQRFRDLQLTLSQRVGESLFFEVAADVNQNQLLGNGLAGRSLTFIYIDVNQQLPTGQPNPNFLEPFGDASGINRNNYTFSFYSVRGAAAYVLKPNRLGKFTFNILGGGTRYTRDQDWRYLSIAQGDDHRLWGFVDNPNNQQIKFRYYLKHASRPYPDLAKRDVTFIDPISGVTKTIRPIWAVNTTRSDTQATDEFEFKYALASANAKLFKDRLVLLGAVRKDYYDFRVSRTLDRGDYPRDWDGVTRIHRPDAPADYATLTYQPRNANGTPSGPVREAINRPRVGAMNDPDPLYLNDRFKDDYNAPPVEGSQVTRSFGAVAHLKPWLNPFFNYAQTFNPPDGTVRINGESRPPTVAWGRDYGIRLELFQNKLNLSALMYEASEDNAVESGAIPNFNALFDANIVGDQSVTGRNIRGAAQLPGVYRDSRSRLNEGYEFEAVWNPARGFRLIANYARPKTGFGGRFPDVLGFIEANAALFKQIAQDAGVLIDANNVARVDESVPINNRSPDVNTAVSTYNAITLFQTTFSGNAPAIGDSPSSANLYGDYTIQQGRFRNLRLGAGVQWRGRIARGNRAADTIVNPANPAQAIDDPSVNASNLIYAPAYSLVTATLAYTWKLKDRRELQASLVVSNLLDDRDPMFLGTYVRPRNNDYTTPARETVLGGTFAFKQPRSYNLRLTLKM